MNPRHLQRYDVDMLGGGVLVLTALVGYALLVHRPLTDSLRYAEVLAQHEETLGKVTALKAQLHSMKSRLAEDGRSDCEEAGPPAPDVMDDLLGKLNDLASQCGVVVTRLQPTGAAERAGYQIRAFLFEGTASFPALHRWFAMMESQVPYSDVTHFAIRGTKIGKGDEETVCSFECSQRLYFSTLDSQAKAPAQEREAS